MNTQQLAQLLASTVPAHLPTMTLGAPGLGKSAIHRQVAEHLGYDYRVIYPALLDPTDLAGLPVPVSEAGQKRVERLLADDLADIFSTQTPTLLLLDELGQASPAVQAACAPIILARRIGKYSLPDHVTVAAATNRRSDLAGAGSILTHLISRMSTVVTLEADSEAWVKWAVGADLRPEVISFIRFRPAMLHDFDAEKARSEVGAYPCPRSWEYQSSLLTANLPESVEGETYAGCVGHGAAAEFMSHLKLARTLMDIDEILRNPTKFKMPKEQSVRYAVASGLATRCNRENADAVVTIAESWLGSHGEYAMMLVRDILTRWPDFQQTHAWNHRVIKGPLKRAIMEA